MKPETECQGCGYSYTVSSSVRQAIDCGGAYSGLASASLQCVGSNGSATAGIGRLGTHTFTPTNPPEVDIGLAFIVLLSGMADSIFLCFPIPIALLQINAM